MNFVDLQFATFFVVFAAGFFFLKGKARLILCLVASYYFYACWDWRFLALIGLSTVVDFFVGKSLESCGNTKKRWLLLLVSLSVNLGVLFTFKYLQFFLDSAVRLLAIFGISASEPTLSLILPVGVSFYTFQTLSYTIDVYRKRLPAERSLLNYAVFVSFFPQLVAGPIVRASSFIPQLREIPAFNWERVRISIQLILWGYFLKTCVADNIAPFVDSCFAWPGAHSSISLIMGAILFSFQLYGDFAGYSLIAIGIGRFLGFDFGVNFRHPFFTTNFSDFWARWHISLSTWLRDYLFVPLGGFSRSQWRIHLALIVTFFLAGLWHGANWNFVIFGLMHGVFLSALRLMTPNLERFAKKRGPVANRFWIAFCMGGVFLLTTLSFVFFRSTSLGDAWTFLSEIAKLDTFALSSIRYKFIVAKSLLMIVILLGVEIVSINLGGEEFLKEHPYVNALLIAMLAVVIAFFGSFSGNSFIYFQF